MDGLIAALRLAPMLLAHTAGVLHWIAGLLPR